MSDEETSPSPLDADGGDAQTTDADQSSTDRHDQASSDPNPFDRLGVDPTMTPAQLTRRLRRIAERLPAAQRDELRTLWRKLTLKDADRVRWAFLAHPRGADTAADDIDELRQKVPPSADQSSPPELRASVADALLDFNCVEPPPETLCPPSGFSAIADEAQPRSTDPQDFVWEDPTP